MSPLRFSASLREISPGRRRGLPSRCALRSKACGPAPPYQGGQLFFFSAAFSRGQLFASPPFLRGSLRLCVRFLRECGEDSLPAALCGAKLAGPLPLFKGDSCREDSLPAQARARSPLSRGTVIFFLRGVFKGGQVFFFSAAFSRGRLFGFTSLRRGRGGGGELWRGL